MNYTEQVPEYGSLITIEEFIEFCKDGLFIDYDGFGHPIKDNLMDTELNIYPSQRNLIPKDATHIMWFNR